MLSERDGLPTKARFWAMVAIGLALSIAVLDSTIANIALPTISADFKITPKNSIWIVNAYQLTLTICLLPFASLGDIVGYRKIYTSGLGIFCAASLCCAISSNLPALTLARVLQGVGAAGILSVNTALLREIYPHHLIGRGIGVNAFIVAVAAALGPTIAALILSIASWQWLFAINVPIALLALKISNEKLPESVKQNYPFDWANAVLCAMVFSVLIITIDSIGQKTHLLQIISGVIFVILMGWVLIKREKATTVPLLPVDLLSHRLFRLSVLTSFCSFVAQMATYVSLPFYFLHVLNQDAVRTGLLITPWPVAIAITAPIAGYLSDKYSAAILGALGLFLFATGLVVLMLLNEHSSYLDIIWRMALCGCGFGFFQAPNNRMLLSATPRARSGAAGGLMATARLLGQTTGASLVALVFGLVSREPNRTILVIAAFIALFAACVSLIRVQEKPSIDINS